MDNDLLKCVTDTFHASCVRGMLLHYGC